MWSVLKFWSFPGGPHEPTLHRNPVKRSFACQGGSYPWHGACSRKSFGVERMLDRELVFKMCLSECWIVYWCWEGTGKVLEFIVCGANLLLLLGKVLVLRVSSTKYWCWECARQSIGVESEIDKVLVLRASSTKYWCWGRARQSIGFESGFDKVLVLRVRLTKYWCWEWARQSIGVEGCQQTKLGAEKMLGKVSVLKALV